MCVHRHGLARTDYHILYDPKLAFREIVMAKMAQAKAASAAAGYHGNMTVPQSWPGELVKWNKSFGFAIALVYVIKYYVCKVWYWHYQQS